MHCDNGLCTAKGGQCAAREASDGQLEAACAPNSRRCGAVSSVELCGDDRAWHRLEACEGDKPVCARASCRGCVPRLARCSSPSKLEVCGEAERFDPAPACPSWAPSCAGAECAPELSLSAGGAHVCAKLSTDEVVCWGENASGQLGTGDRWKRRSSELDPELTKVALGGAARVRLIAAGGAHTCVLLEGGNVKCWGENQDGQLGVGDRIDRGVAPEQMGDALPFVDLGSARPVIALAAGGRHTCALTDDGLVKCWGANDAGQLGVGDTENRGDEPNELGVELARVELGNEPAIAIDAGDEHTCTVLADGGVQCWGSDDLGQHGTFGGAVSRVGIDPRERAVAVTAGGNHACARLGSGGVVCWGFNRSGQLGSGDLRNRGQLLEGVAGELTHVNLGAGRSALSLSAGANHTCALLSDRTVTCWGNDFWGQLGRGSAGEARGDVPEELGDSLVAVELGTRDGAAVLASALSASTDFTCVVLDGGEVKCWGLNSSGQLGLGDVSTRGDEPLGDALPAVSLPR
jgi:alpha-tubulin suppressor-like RCC1 family protein